MRCPKCGRWNSKKAYRCADCGAHLHHRFAWWLRKGLIFCASIPKKPLAFAFLALCLALGLWLLLSQIGIKKQQEAVVLPTNPPFSMQKELLALKVGQELPLLPLYPETYLNYESADETIALALPDGTIRGTGEGETVITVTNGFGEKAVCAVSVTAFIRIMDFSIPEKLAYSFSHNIKGEIASNEPLSRVCIEIYALKDGTLSSAPELKEQVSWEENGPTQFSLNDEEKNLNKAVAFSALSMGNKRLFIKADTVSQSDVLLYSADFEVYEEEHPYASSLNAEKYPCLAPSQWGKWLVWEKNLHHNIDPVFMGRLAAFAKAQGKKLTIVSAFRTREKQEELYRAYHDGSGNPANRPGTSWHEFGGAVDVGTWARDVKESVYKKFGLCKPVDREDWHIQPVETVSKTDKEKFYHAYSSKTYPKWSENCYMRR